MGPNELLDKGFLATSEIPWYHVVAQDGVEGCELNTTAGGDWLGICQEVASERDVTDGRVVRVRPMGISRGVAGGIFSIRARLASDDEGKLVAAAAGDHVVGIALTASLAAGDWVDVQLTPGVQVPATP
jgi:hypothetical protein